MADEQDRPKYPFRHVDIRKPAEPIAVYDPLRAFAEERTDIGLTKQGIKAKRGRLTPFERLQFIAYWVGLSLLLSLFFLGWLSRLLSLAWPSFAAAMVGVMALVYGAVRVWDAIMIARQLNRAPSPSQALRDTCQARLDGLRLMMAPLRRAYPPDWDGFEHASLCERFWRGHMLRHPPLGKALAAYDAAGNDDARRYAFDDVVRVCGEMDEEIAALERLAAERHPATRHAAWLQIDQHITMLKEACGQPPTVDVPVLSKVRVEPAADAAKAAVPEPARSMGLLARLRVGKG